MARKTVRVNIPANKPDAFLRLLSNVIKKHDQMGDKSPLSNLDTLDMKLFKASMQSVEQKRDKSEQLRQEAENLMQQAYTTLGISKGQTVNTPNTLYNTITTIKEYLLVLHRGNEEALSEWGFNVVVGTARSPRKGDAPAA